MTLSLDPPLARMLLHAAGADYDERDDDEPRSHAAGGA